MARVSFALLCAAALCVLASSRTARADWLQPDPSYREAQIVLRIASRDTAGHPFDPGRLDSLGLSLLRLARLDEADRIFARSLEVAPSDEAALAGRGKIALFRGRVSEAESLLARIPTPDREAAADLLAARMRLGDFAGAATVAPLAGEEGRIQMLERMGRSGIYRITPGRDHANLIWSRSYPVPLVRVKLNGQSVLMALDTGTADVLLDDSWARRCKVEPVPGQRLEFWCGSRVAVRNAMVQRLEVGGTRVEHIPAGTLSLRRWSLEVNPQSEPVAGIIGLEFLARFTPTLDYHHSRLVLEPKNDAYQPRAGAVVVPFQTWGRSELTVYGSLAGSRTMALVVETGVPGCGVGAPSEVMDEIGVKSGVMSRLVKGAGSWLQGRPWARVTVPSVAVGAVVKDQVPGWLGALDASELWRHGVRRDALLSSGFFTDWSVTIDWKGQRLVFEE